MADRVADALGAAAPAAEDPPEALADGGAQPARPPQKLKPYQATITYWKLCEKVAEEMNHDVYAQNGACR
ncbi:unnamed protein product, partial [Prorocentrum cordatum]